MMMMIQVSIMVKRLSSFKWVMIVGVHFVDLNNVCNLFFFQKRDEKVCKTVYFEAFCKGILC